LPSPRRLQLLQVCSSHSEERVGRAAGGSNSSVAGKSARKEGVDGGEQQQH